MTDTPEAEAPKPVTQKTVQPDRKGVIGYYLQEGHGANMTVDSSAAIYLLSWFRKGVRLAPSDFQCELLSDTSKQPQFLEFVFLVAATHPRFCRAWNPHLWDTVAREIWKQRCSSHRPPFTPFPAVPISNKQILSMVKTLDDLHAFFEQLLGLWEYVQPEFLATRPPYMKPHGDQAEPTWGTYTAMFEAFFTSPEHYAILTASPQECDAFFTKFCPKLRRLAYDETMLRRMWYSYQTEFYRKRRAEFKRHFRQLIIAEALRPARVAKLLEAHGFDVLENVFGS
jgi:hypothetical protein